MAVRAAGYENVVKAGGGTWPTGHMTKAVELGMLDGIKTPNGNDGAKRGDIALLTWNMLTTPMWQIDEENATTGVTYRKGDYMLNVKFPDYAYYEEAVVDGWNIEDGKVLVSLVTGTDDKDNDIVAEFEYSKNDFYTFVKGTEVTALANVEDEEFLSIVPTTDNKLVEGREVDLDEDYEDATYADGTSYTYARVEKKAFANQSDFKVTSEYVEKVAEASKYITINSGKYTDKEYDDTIVIIDGERATLRDVEEGNVLSKVELLKKTDGTIVETFFIVSSDEFEGTLKKYVLSSKELTVDDETFYVAANAEYIEDPEDEDSEAVPFGNDGYTKFKDEEIRVITDFIGNVVRIETGKLTDEDDNSYGFYNVVSFAERDTVDGERVYTIELENEDGVESYTFADSAYSVGKEYDDADKRNQFSLVKFNDDGEIEAITLIAQPKNTTLATLPGGEDLDGSEYTYTTKEITDATYNKGYIESKSNIVDSVKKIAVDDDVVVVKLLTDDSDAEDVKYSIEFVVGIDEIEGLDDDKAAVIYDAAEAFNTAKYVLIWDDARAASDTQFSKVEEDSVETDATTEKTLFVTDADEEYFVAAGASANQFDADLVFVAYEIRENSKDEEELVYIAGLEKEELTSKYTEHGLVTEVANNGRRIMIDGTTEFNLNDETNENKYEDYDVVIVNVTETLTEGQYEVTSYEATDYASARAKKDDRISIDEKGGVIFIIRGIEVE